MGILIINSEYPPIGGGAGNASANLARCFATAGHQVAVLTARYANSPALEESHNLFVHRISAFRHRQDRSGALEQLAFIVAASLYAPRLVREFQPQVVLAFFGVPSGAVAWFLHRRFGIPYVVSLRGGDVPGFRPYDFRLYHRLISPLLRVIWRNASAVVANSKGLRGLAREFDPGIEIPVIPNGVDVREFAVGRRSWSPARLLSVGRVVHQKGLDLGLEALAGLKDLPWDWSIAGDGPQTAALRERVKQLGLEDRVHFLGWQERDQLAARYREANLFLFPSRHEGMPNALLEAMASGLPVVATRIAGNEELVQEGVTGKLVDAEDVPALKESLRQLISDPYLRKRMGVAARQRVEREYSWESAADEYLKMLQHTL
jgi:glycosyltransferase involved in cell wall biosynthesis